MNLKLFLSKNKKRNLKIFKNLKLIKNNNNLQKNSFKITYNKRCFTNSLNIKKEKNKKTNNSLFLKTNEKLNDIYVKWKRYPKKNKLIEKRNKIFKIKQKFNENIRYLVKKINFNIKKFKIINNIVISKIFCNDDNKYKNIFKIINKKYKINLNGIWSNNFKDINSNDKIKILIKTYFNKLVNKSKIDFTNKFINILDLIIKYLNDILLINNYIEFYYQGTSLFLYTFIDNFLYFSNIGEFKVIIFELINNKWRFKVLNYIHFPENINEKKRIIKNKGYFNYIKDKNNEPKGLLKLFLNEKNNTYINYTRSVGNYQFINSGLSLIPDSICYPIKNKENLLIIGSLRFWKILNPQLLLKTLNKIYYYNLKENWFNEFNKFITEQINNFNEINLNDINLIYKLILFNKIK